MDADYDMEIQIKEAELEQLQAKASLLEKELQLLKLKAKAKDNMTTETEKKEETSIQLPTEFEEAKQQAYEDKYYVILNGPNQGIYENWAEAQPLCIEQGNVAFQKCKSRKDAEDLLAKAGKKISLRPTYERKADSIKLPSHRLPQMREELKRHIEPNKEEYIEMMKELYSWNGDCSKMWYKTDRTHFGYKMNIIPGANPLWTWKAFLYGMVETIYPSPDMQELTNFPEGIKSAITLWRKNMFKNNTNNPRDIYIKCFGSYGEFNGEMYVKPKYFIKLGISNGSYPVADAGPGSIPSQLKVIQVNQLISIFEKMREIDNDSKIKMNYKNPDTIITSGTNKGISEKEYRLLVAWEAQFYDFSGINYSEEIKTELCERLRTVEDHMCTRCQEGSSSSPEIIDE